MDWKNKRHHRRRGSSEENEAKLITLRSGKRIISQFVNYCDSEENQDERDSPIETTLFDHTNWLLRNGQESRREKKKVHGVLTSDQQEPFDFDYDGELSNAIKAKLKDHMGIEINGVSVSSDDSCTSDTLKNNKESVSSNCVPMIVEGNAFNLDYVPLIFKDQARKLNSNLPLELNTNKSIVKLFSNKKKYVKGQVEVVEWESEPKDGYGNNSIEGCDQGLNLSRDVGKPPSSKKRKKSESEHRKVVEKNYSDIRQDMNISTASFESLDYHHNVVYVGPDFCVVTLKYPSIIFFYGKVKVSCLYGNVEFLGHRLKEDYQDVYSARSGGAMCFESFPADVSAYGLFGKLRKIGVPITKTEEIVTTMRPDDGIIVLKSLDNSMTKFIEKHFSNFHPFSMKRSTTNSEFSEVEKILKCNLFLEPPKQFFNKNSQWEEVISAVQDNNVAVVAGGKSAGKSTFLRYYVNKALAVHQSIAVIDLDPGQSEFTIATSLSVTVVHKPLLGANFTHLQKSARMYNIGTINVMENLERYILATKELIDYCRNDSVISALPWIINTMGMSDETGLQLIAYIITLSVPNVVIQLGNKNGFSILLRPENVYRLWRDYCTSIYFLNIHLDREYHNYEYYNITREEQQHGDSVISVPKRERFLSVLAYFSQMVSSGSKTVMDAIPYVAPLDKLKIVTTSIIPEKNICSVINGKIVALCSSTEWNDSCTSINVLNKSYAICYGYGIIRGTDPESKLIYIISPIKKHSICKVNTLILLELLPDLCSLNETSFDLGTKIPYSFQLSNGIVQQRLLKTPQRRFNILQLLKMKSANSPK